MAYEFRSDEAIADSSRRCAREQLDRAIEALTEEFEQSPVDAVHTARKSVKKVRALLRLSRGSLPQGQRRAENEALRAAASNLTGIRDADVMLQTLEGLSERFAGQLPDTTFAAVREQLEGRHVGTAGVEAGAAAAEDLRAIRARVDEWTLRKDGWSAIRRGLRRSYRCGRRAVDRAGRDPSTENLHAARKRVKDLWYELRLLALVCGPAIRGQAQDADQLAELLGADHDLAVLRQTLVGEAPELAVDLDALLSLIDYRRDQLQTQSFCIAERVYAEKPSAFTRRVRRCWAAGRHEHQAFQARHPAALAQTTRAVGAGEPDTGVGGSA